MYKTIERMEGEGMKIEHIIDSDTKAKLGVLNKGKGKSHSNGKKRNKRYSERLNERDIKELMGQYQPTYKRKNGAIRRK